MMCFISPCGSELGRILLLWNGVWQILPDDLVNVNRFATGGEDRQPERHWKCQGDLCRRPPFPTWNLFHLEAVEFTLQHGLNSSTQVGCKVPKYPKQLQSAGGDGIKQDLLGVCSWLLC